MLVTVLFTISAKTSRHSLCRRSAGAVVEVGGADRRRFLYVDSPRTSLTRFLTSPATSPRDRLTRHRVFGHRFGSLVMLFEGCWDEFCGWSAHTNTVKHSARENLQPSIQQPYVNPCPPNPQPSYPRPSPRSVSRCSWIDPCTTGRSIRPSTPGAFRASESFFPELWHLV